MAFLGVFKRYFPRRMPYCFIKIHVHAKLGPMPLIHDIAQFDPFTNLSPFKYAFNVIQNWAADTSFTVLLDCAYFLLVVMVEGHESSRLRMAN